jgi:hypothetical protein
MTLPLLGLDACDRMVKLNERMAANYCRCMFGSVGKGRMAKPWGAVNTVGYQPSFVRGLHLVRGRNDSTTFSSSSSSSSTSSAEVREHCALECKGALLRALSGMVLEAAAHSKIEASSAAARFEEKRSSLLSDTTGRGDSIRRQQNGYQTDVCVPEYAQVPCPMYPPPEGDSAKWEYSGASMRSSLDPATLVAQTARQATLSDKLRADLAEVAARTKPFQSGSKANTSAVFASWEDAFATGGGNGCRGVKEYARFVGRDWCEAALKGPGGQAATVGSNSRLRGLQAEPPIEPSGWWCALPQRGHWPIPAYLNP